MYMYSEERYTDIEVHVCTVRLPYLHVDTCIFMVGAY